jgi:hypothetical protein
MRRRWKEVCEEVAMADVQLGLPLPRRCMASQLKFQTWEPV